MSIFMSSIYPCSVVAFSSILKISGAWLAISFISDSIFQVHTRWSSKKAGYPHGTFEAFHERRGSFIKAKARDVPHRPTGTVASIAITAVLTVHLYKRAS